MKKLAALLTITFVLASAAFAEEGVFRTVIISPADPTLTVTVQAHQSIRLQNFIQTGTGATDTNGNVTGGVAYAQIGNETAAIATSSQEPKNVIIAGPGSLVVPAIGGTGTLFVTYRLAVNR